MIMNGTANYSYNKKLWKPSLTKLGKDNFFHATFGTRNSEAEEYSKSDRYIQIIRKNWENCLIYIKNETVVGSAEKSVTIEDISILATLENIKIIIMSKTEPPNVITPNEEILRNYPYRSASCKTEVVLFQQNDIFFRMDEESSMDEGNVQHEQDEKHENNGKCKKDEYDKTGTSGLKGILYQLQLLTIFLLNAFRKPYKWRLSSENKKGDKFDDVVIEWPEGAILLQSKFKENTKFTITLDDLLSNEKSNNNFSLPKYFLSYQKIKGKFIVRNVILCTNTNIADDAKQYLTSEDVTKESMLYYEKGNDLKYYKFNTHILDILKQNTESYFDKNNCKDIEKSVITEENLTDFLEHFQLFCSYPPQCEDMEKVIKNLLVCNDLQGKVSPSELMSKVQNWYQEKSGVFLTRIHSIAKFSEIDRDRYYLFLENHKVSFMQKSQHTWDTTDAKSISHIVTEAGYLLHELKIYSDLQNNKNKILYVKHNDHINIQTEVVDAFGELHYIFLIIIWPITIHPSVIQKMCCQLKKLLKTGKTRKTRKTKKIILVAKKNILLNQGDLVMDDYAAITKYVTFQEFSNNTKEKLLSQKCIIFQGKEVNLNGLFEPKQHYPESIDLETLEKLIKNEQITVENLLDEHNDTCFINCDFQENNIISGVKKTCTIQARGLTTIHALPWDIKIELKTDIGALDIET